MNAYATITEVLAVKHDIKLVKLDIEMMRKDLLLKLGAIIVAGQVVTIGIILGTLSVMLQ